MNLEGKAQDDFWIWYMQQKRAGRKFLAINAFHNYDNSTQWGVYLEWAESQDVYPVIFPNWKMGGKSFRVGFHVIEDNVIDSFFLRPEKDDFLFIEFKTRPEAQQAAIEKLSQLYNEKHK